MGSIHSFFRALGIANWELSSWSDETHCNDLLE